MKDQVLTRAVLIFALLIASGQSAPAQQKASAPAKPSTDMMPTQVLLDRAGFSPGEIDGRGGRNTQTAIGAFEKATSTTIASALEAAEPATIMYSITDQDAGMPTGSAIPEDMMEKAKLKRLDYTSVLEMLAERFHASPNLLKRLNPSAAFMAGEQVTVPNVNVVSDAEAKPIPNIVVRVSKGTSNLTVTDASGKVIMHAPVTSGSEHDPLPIGSWTVTAVARNPTFNYNPDLFWDADPNHAKAKLPPGPNGPVGVVWIDINRPHYGIHGTPEPATVGHLVPRLRAVDQLGRPQAGFDRWKGYEGGVQRMKPARSHAARAVGRPLVLLVAFAFLTGMVVVALVVASPSMQGSRSASTPTISAGPIADLRQRDLTLPVQGITRSDIRDGFNELRAGANRHEAIDMLAPRHTPVLAVEDGTVARLFLSQAGGITVYQFDPTERYIYYYAHLEKYAAGLKEKSPVKRGEVIGYVGTSGNAPRNTPHLHFAIFRMTDDKQWWKGTPIDPYSVLR